MNRSIKQARAGFTLVELLAVVLVLSVLAAIAVPLYLNTRKTSAARTCSANIAAIAAAETAYATRFGTYRGGASGDTVVWQSPYAAGSPPTGGLIGAPEGLASAPACPLDGDPYIVQVVSGVCTIECQNKGTATTGHEGDTGTGAAKWSKVLAAQGNDTTNPF